MVILRVSATSTNSVRHRHDLRIQGLSRLGLPYHMYRLTKLHRGTFQRNRLAADWRFCVRKTGMPLRLKLDF